MMLGLAMMPAVMMLMMHGRMVDDASPGPASRPPGRLLPVQSLHIWHIWDRAAEAILQKQRELAEKGWPENTTIVLDLPCPFLSIMWAAAAAPAADDDDDGCDCRGGALLLRAVLQAGAPGRPAGQAAA